MSRSLHAARLVALAALAAVLWFILSFFSESHSASANAPSPLDPVGSLVGSVTEPLAPVVVPVVAAPAQVVAPVVQAAAPVAAPVVAAVVPTAAPVAAVAAPVTNVVSTVTTPVAAAVAPVVQPLAPVVSSAVEPLAPALTDVVTPLAPVISPILDPLAPVVSPVLNPLAPVVGTFSPVVPLASGVLPSLDSFVGSLEVAPVHDAVDAVLADVASAVGLTVSARESDSAARVTSAGVTPQSSLSVKLATSAHLDSAPGMPREAPLPAAPTALSGSAASSAAGPFPVGADLVRGFDLSRATWAAVSTASDDELPSSPTFPSDETPD
ncbi:hypothetical protein [Conyzicola nivalis]